MEYLPYATSFLPGKNTNTSKSNNNNCYLLNTYYVADEETQV